ncbi:hypothetical protein LCGC14_1476800 [marine sediment metagenome]|uniref:Uncharacterized protein n=1 Tax=marine sediment metagenome TaxID=412755 RepID=A0A0F9JWR3_9ZZZZ
MAFTHATAPHGQRKDAVLSADNAPSERHIVIETLRKAASLLGLKPPVVATLDAMLSCLAPKRNHNVVFASNATLTFRRNGISDRTIRRHVAILQDAGLLERQDSPNGKRFTRHSRAEGRSVRFGFDLTPLFTRLPEISRLALRAEQQREQIAYLRCKLRAAVHGALSSNPTCATALEALRLLRRKLDASELSDLLSIFTTLMNDTTDMDPPLVTEELAGSDGQFVRHHHRSNKELTDKMETAPTDASQASAGGLSVRDLKRACPEATGLAPERVETAQDVIDHAQALAPMLGIDKACYQQAQTRLGPFGAAATIWALLEFHGRLHSVGAYFRSITTGRKSAGFDPIRLIRRLGVQGPDALGLE